MARKRTSAQLDMFEARAATKKRKKRRTKSGTGKGKAARRRPVATRAKKRVVRVKAYHVAAHTRKKPRTSKSTTRRTRRARRVKRKS